MLNNFLLALRMFSIPLHPAGHTTPCSLHSHNDDPVEWEVQLQSGGPLLTLLSLRVLVTASSSHPFRPRASCSWRMPLPHCCSYWALGHCATPLGCPHLEIVSLRNSSHYPRWGTISFLPGPWTLIFLPFFSKCLLLLSPAKSVTVVSVFLYSQDISWKITWKGIHLTFSV